MTWLWDNVYSIREAATLNLKKLAEVFGLEWAKVEIIPHIIVVSANANYLYRLTVLFAVSTLIPVVDMGTINESILPFLEKLMTDPIPNIRFSIAKTYKVLVSALLNPEYPESEEAERAKEAEEENAVKSKGEKDKTDEAGIPQPPKVVLRKKLPLGPRANSETIKEIVNKTVIPNLEQLADDSDVDVRYFANKSLEEIDELVRESIGEEVQA